MLRNRLCEQVYNLMQMDPVWVVVAVCPWSHQKLCLTPSTQTNPTCFLCAQEGSRLYKAALMSILGQQAKPSTSTAMVGSKAQGSTASVSKPSPADPKKGAKAKKAAEAAANKKPMAKSKASGKAKGKAKAKAVSPLPADLLCQAIHGRS